MNILGISGSPRKDGNTDIILKKILAGAGKSKLETKIIFLRDYTIHFCVGCEKCRISHTCSQFNDDMNFLYPLVEDADILILGSPVYNYNITAQMKAFIDRLYPYYEFSTDRPRKYRSRLRNKNRQLIAFSIAEQTDPGENGFALEAIARPLEALGYHTLEKVPVTGFFDKGSIKKNTRILQNFYTLGRDLAKLTEST